MAIIASNAAKLRGRQRWIVLHGGGVKRVFGILGPRPGFHEGSRKGSKCMTDLDFSYRRNGDACKC
jgi:hypothetical protein